MDNRRAIYIPFAQAVPKVATIDPELLQHAQEPASAVCARRSALPAPSTTSRRTRSSSEQYGAIVVATGFNPIKLDQFDEFAYSQSQGRGDLAWSLSG